MVRIAPLLRFSDHLTCVYANEIKFGTYETSTDVYVIHSLSNLSISIFMQKNLKSWL